MKPASLLGGLAAALVGLGALVLFVDLPGLQGVRQRLTALTGLVGAARESEKTVAPPPEPSQAGSASPSPLGGDGPLPPVKLSTPEIAARVGLKQVPVETRPFAPAINGNAEIVYNANLYGEVRPRVAGIVREVIADEGSHMKTGQTMLRIDSATVGTAKSEYLAALSIERLAQQTLDMTLKLRRDNAAPLKEEMKARADETTAQAAVLNAKQRLKNLGFGPADLAKIDQEQDTSTMLDVVSPLAGVVVERHAVPGEAIEPTDRVFVVADIHQMWAWIDVEESDIEDVKAGQPVSLTVSGMGSQVFRGQVDWIDTAVNPATRTVRVRAVMNNEEHRLRANEFGRARIQVGEERPAQFVPREAVQAIGDGGQVVFVPQAEGAYQPVRVTTAPAESRGVVRVVTGLEAGSTVVSTGAFLLKSELLKQAEQ